MRELLGAGAAFLDAVDLARAVEQHASAAILAEHAAKLSAARSTAEKAQQEKWRFAEGE
jgi:hypothetical protein